MLPKWMLPHERRGQSSTLTITRGWMLELCCWRWVLQAYVGSLLDKFALIVEEASNEPHITLSKMTAGLTSPGGSSGGYGGSSGGYGGSSGGYGGSSGGYDDA
jgi:uncharacterized membrane protein YgcG